MNKTLYGKDDERFLVGLHREGDNMRLYTRLGGKVKSRLEPFHPFLFVTEKGHEVLEEASPAAWSKRLNGSGEYQWLEIFDSWKAQSRARRLVDRSEWYSAGSSETQYLMQTGKTLFNGLAPEKIVRMQLDIEVYTEHGFPNAAREEDEIIIIAITTNQGAQYVLHTNEELKDWKRPYFYFESESEMLAYMVRLIHKIDPDVIEGHNIFAFDLPYIRARAIWHGVPLAIGRNSAEPFTYAAKKSFAERDFDYTMFKIAGRSVYDTLFAAIEYDVYKRDLPGYGLKEIAKHFGFAPEGRTYIAGEKISWHWKNDPEPLMLYALDDVIETERVAAHLLASAFELTKMLPMTFQRTHTAGTAGSIEALFVREYLTRRESLPKPDAGKAGYTGGYTDIFQRGVFRNACYADVNSLYPSIMLFYSIKPKGDSLQLFYGLLKDLTDLRFATKAEMKKYPKGSPQYNALDAQQAAYKILINSFYGMLGHAHSLFCDFEEAERVTLTGRKLLKRMMHLITERGGKVILVDTDGVLFELPRDPMTDDEVDAFVKEISDRMPNGINVGNDGRFDRVLSYRPKNYVLLEQGSEKPKFKGVSFKGRSAEPFLVRFVKRVASAILYENTAEVRRAHDDALKLVVDSAWTPEDFRSRASLKQSLNEYDAALESNENKNQQAGYEIAKRMKEDGKDIRRGDVIYYYVSGNKPKSRVTIYEDAKPIDEWTPGDENRRHYLGRLQDAAKKFDVFFTPEDFKRVFPLDPKKLAQALMFEEPVTATIQNTVVNDVQS